VCTQPGCTSLNPPILHKHFQGHLTKRSNTAILGLARTIHIRCIYDTFGREITKYTVICGVYMRFWPTLSNTQFLRKGAFKRLRPNARPTRPNAATKVGLTRTVYIYTVYDRIYGEFPAKNTVYTPCIYGSGQP